MDELIKVSDSKCFGGQQQVYEHKSKELKCKMKFTIFLPSAASDPDAKLPVVYFLADVICKEETLITRSGFQRYAEEYELIVVGPDTSPRGCNVPGESDSWELGTSAGFYVDATQKPWKKNYRMYSYVTKELAELIETNFSQADSNRVGISGFSMGGHGALVAFFRNPQIYKAVSALSPIANASESTWGILAMNNYLGSNPEAWKEYDAYELVKKRPRKDVKILIDQGSSDRLINHLMPQRFVEACQEVGQPLEFTMRENYGHNQYFVATFIGNHLKHLSRELTGQLSRKRKEDQESLGSNLTKHLRLQDE